MVFTYVSVMVQKVDELMKKVLYISYDGMTDPLGQSQVLPYLIGLSKYGYRFTILSFEKKERFKKFHNIIEKIVSEASISWVPLRFTTRPPFLSKLYDVLRMRRKALHLQKIEKFDMVHCRSYLAADIGLAFKKRFGTKFFFDMRGFWADEKKDAGTWKQSSFLFRKIYRYYKQKEIEYLKNADYIISLTLSGKKEMMKWSSYNPSAPIGVIPCCADMELFTLTSVADKIEGRKILGMQNEGLVISYLGSIGAWYMLDEMLELFSYIKLTYSDAKFLFITHSKKEMILSKLGEHHLSEKDILIVEATRQQVPLYVKASDINISFIKPVYSKISSSPTKLGEVLAMGIPVIANAGVGDVEETLLTTDSGVILREFNELQYKKVVSIIPGLLSKDPSEIRNKIYSIYSLEQGVANYLNFYQKVFAS